MTSVVQSLIRTAEHHLDRVAYRTRDNPYLRAAGAASLTLSENDALAAVLSSGPSLPQSVRDAVAEGAFGTVGLGTLPREVQVVVPHSQPLAGAASVTAFARASRFWHVISFLWCMEVGRAVDSRLEDTIVANRLHPTFVANPRFTGQMFRRSPSMARQWAHVVSEASSAVDGAPVTAATADLRGFYYSVTAGPTDILRAFAAIGKRRLRVSSRGRVLGQLLDVAHNSYAHAGTHLEPRGIGPAIGSAPLPVGFPSSQILANLVMAVILRDLARKPDVLAVSAYVDDILIVSSNLPRLEEGPVEFLSRQGLTDEIDKEVVVLSASAAGRLARLVVAPEKCGIAYGRALEPSIGTNEEDATQAETGGDGAAIIDNVEPDDLSDFLTLDPYFELPEDDEWTGQLGTTLRAPFRRDRVPSELVRDLFQLTDEIRIGIEAADAGRALKELLKRTDPASRLALRPYWTELLACMYFVGGDDAVADLLQALGDTFEALIAPGHASDELSSAIRDALRFTLGQSLAEALAAAASPSEPLPTVDRALLNRATSLAPEQLASTVRMVRRGYFTSAHLVSSPLAEFTGWKGPLFGWAAQEAFDAWASASPRHVRPDRLHLAVSGAKRFVQLHEVCLALHLWSAPGNAKWGASLFQIFGAQPLLHRPAVADLKKRVRALLRGLPTATQDGSDDDDVVLRFAVPSIGVAGDQLKAIIDGNRKRTSDIARAARKGIISTTREAAKRRATVLVFPEWSLPERQLPWVFERSAKDQILIVGGEAPRVTTARKYSNRVWTGLPLVDLEGRRMCVVPPPREKLHLSNAERADMAKGGLQHAPASLAIPAYRWRGIGLASLICFEFADIQIRDALRPVADLITVSSWNMDWRYFDAIQEATTRDNYCFTVCVNTSQFPGTHIMRPTKSEKAIALSVHGAGDPAIIVRELDLRPVVEARRTGQHPSEIPGLPAPTDGLGLDDYKALPPSFR